MAPLCDTSAILPYFGVIFRNVEFIMLSFEKLIIPRQFGPITLMSYFLAISPTSLSSLAPASSRSEEHTSELQSRQYLVCRLLLEKKKKYKILSLLIQNN